MQAADSQSLNDLLFPQDSLTLVCAVTGSIVKMSLQAVSSLCGTWFQLG